MACKVFLKVFKVIYNTFSILRHTGRLPRILSCIADLVCFAKKCTFLFFFVWFPYNSLYYARFALQDQERKRVEAERVAAQEAQATLERNARQKEAAENVQKARDAEARKQEERARQIEAERRR